MRYIFSILDISGMKTTVCDEWVIVTLQFLFKLKFQIPLPKTKLSKTHK